MVATTPAVLVSLVAPGFAHATVHSGRIVFPEPKNPPSIGTPPPPADQTREYDREVILIYDASAGSVTMIEEVWDASYWGEELSEGINIGASPHESILGPDDLHLSLTARPKRIEPGLGGAEEERGGVTGTATLRDYTGEVLSKGTFNGTRFEITLTSSAFRNKDWRCVAVTQTGSFKPSTFYLNHWSKPKRKVKHKRH